MRSSYLNCFVIFLLLINNVISSSFYKSNNELITKALKFDKRSMPLQETYNKFDISNQYYSQNLNTQSIFMCIDIENALKFIFILKSTKVKGFQTIYTSKRERVSCFIVHDKISFIEVKYQFNFFHL